MKLRRGRVRKSKSTVPSPVLLTQSFTSAEDAFNRMEKALKAFNEQLTKSTGKVKK